MKRIFTLLIAALLTTGFCSNLMAQDKELTKAEKKELKKQEKERKKKIEETGDAIAFEMAAKSLKGSNFVIEADQLQSDKGGITHVNPNTNFITIVGEDATVQIAPSNHIAGPNGVGGITLDGKVSNVKISTDKKGSITYACSILGAGISASVHITLHKGSSTAYATVFPNFSSNDVTLIGKVKSPKSSLIFKGRSI